MKRVTIVSHVDPDKCRGCGICIGSCPVCAISLKDKIACIDEDACRGCANCADRCPYYAAAMVKREQPFDVQVDVGRHDPELLRAMCEKAHFNPQQVLCYCVGTRAEEVAAAILEGAVTPEAVSSRTGMRTGCTIECIQPLLRMLSANGCRPEPDPKGWRWYGETVTAWTIPEEVKAKYGSRGFYFDEDRALLDKIAFTRNEDEGGKGGKCHE